MRTCIERIWGRTALLATLAGLLAAGWSAQALADSVALNVTGTITATTCTVAAGSGTQTVDMGSIDASTFSAVNTTTAAKDFFVKLNCGSITQLWVAMQMGTTANADSDNPALFKLTGGDGAATGVALELLDSASGTPAIRPGATINWLPASTADAASGYKFSVRYRQTKAAVTPGAANASMVVDITYK